MDLHNFIRESDLYNDDFKNYEDEFPEDLHDEASIEIMSMTWEHFMIPLPLHY
jgi:hypothetical protein